MRAIRPTTNCPSTRDSSGLRARLGRGPPATRLGLPTKVCTTGRSRPCTSAVPGSAARTGSAGPCRNTRGAHLTEHLIRGPACTRSDGWGWQLSLGGGAGQKKKSYSGLPSPKRVPRGSLCFPAALPQLTSRRPLPRTETVLQSRNTAGWVRAPER